MPETPHSEAQRYLDKCIELREELGIPQAATLRAHPLGQGEHNANFWFEHPISGKKLVLRMNYASQLGLEKQATYEFRALQLLQGSGRTPLPLFLDDDRQIVQRGVLLIDFLEGTHLNFAHAKQVRMAAQLLADIHSVKPPKQNHLLAPADPLNAQLEECRDLFDRYRASNLRDSAIVARVERFFDVTEQALADLSGAAYATHILNTEAVPSHFLIPANGGQGHMVDWEKPVIGEAAQDVAYFLAPTTTIWDTDFIFPVSKRARFVETYQEAVDGRFDCSHFEERLAAYLKTNCLRGITWSCAAWVEYHDPRRPLRNAKTFEKLKTYLSSGFIDLLEREVFPQ